MSRSITQDEWNSFLARHAHAVFLQSWEWGESVRQRERVEVFRIAFPSVGPVRAVMQLFERGRGTPFHYWYASGGPVAYSREDTQHILEAALVHPQIHKAVFLRFEPRYRSFFSTSMHRTHDGRPSRTRVIDLSQGKELIFSAMHEKTRYNIRLAARNDVCVREVFYQEWNRAEMMERFYTLLRETAARGRFSLHPWPHYVGLVETFLRATRNAPLVRDTPCLRFYVAWHGHWAIAMILCMSFGDTVTYLHGASSYRHRALMGSYALHWQAIQDAIQAGYLWYDVWGVAPKNARDDHPWAGITQFKNGFGGEAVEYPGTFDITLRPIHYALYSASRAMKRAIRLPIQ